MRGKVGTRVELVFGPIFRKGNDQWRKHTSFVLDDGAYTL